MSAKRSQNSIGAVVNHFFRGLTDLVGEFPNVLNGIIYDFYVENLVFDVFDESHDNAAVEMSSSINKGQIITLNNKQRLKGTTDYLSQDCTIFGSKSYCKKYDKVTFTVNFKKVKI